MGRRIRSLATGYRSCGFCSNKVKEEWITVITTLLGKPKQCCPRCLKLQKKPLEDRLGPYRVLARIGCGEAVGFVGYVYG